MTTLSGKGRILTADIEAVGLLPDIRDGHREDLHILHLKDYETGELFSFFDDFDERIDPTWLNDQEEGFKQGNILEGRDWMQDCEILIMHNISGFDALALEKSVGFKRDHFKRIDNPVFPFATCDTLTMSFLLNPERPVPKQAYAQGLGNIGPHGIAAYGALMGRLKPEQEDWSTLTPEMINRVSEDVEIGEWAFDYLMAEWNEQLKRPNKMTGKDIRDAYLVELRMAFTVSRQAQRGFAFDTALAVSLMQELDQKIEATERAFRPHMPMRLKMKKLSEDYIESSAVQMQEAMLSTFGNLKAVTGVNKAVSGYENYMLNGNQRGSYAATYWNIVTKAGKYTVNVTKCIPEARGFMQDHPKPPVSGPLTPLVWEEIPLGNRDEVKQILYKHGWRGVNYNEAETDYIEEHGELPKPWSGKIDDASIERWEESDAEVPEWCKGIAEWYVLVSRRTQICNAKDEAKYLESGSWPRQQSKKNECRGLLPKARCFGNTKGVWEGKTGQEYYERTGSWPTSGHWRVPAEAFSCATNTFRMRHKVVVNIPSRGLYGSEMRRLFIAGPGKMLLGCDGAGLELRMLAHFMNDALYTSTVLDGDIHTLNMEMAGLSSRDQAKKFIYMFLYGAGIPNLARQIGMSEHAMSLCVANFKANLPKLDDLMDRVQNAGKNFGYLLSVDGRWGRIRSKNFKLSLNTALNVLLQMTGSLVMKYAHVKAEDLCIENGSISCIEQFPIVAHQHDEGQMEIDAEQVEKYTYSVPYTDLSIEEKRQHIDEQGRVWSAPIKVMCRNGIQFLERRYHPIGDAYCKALKWAGEELGLRCETAGEYQIGKSWQETH